MYPSQTRRRPTVDQVLAELQDDRPARGDLLSITAAARDEVREALLRCSIAGHAEAGPGPVSVRWQV